MVYKILTDDEIIQKNDQYVLAGINPDKEHNWIEVSISIGRTVREQRSRENNYAVNFRRAEKN